jgi:HAD superfamily phosphoserine phosphatase-like hydrolase
MTVVQYSLPPLDGFAIRDLAQVAEKLRLFKQSGRRHIHYVFDFDRTLTTAPVGVDLTTWSPLDSLIPHEQRALHSEQAKHYQNMEFDGRLSEEDAIAWWALTFELYIQHGVKLDQIKQGLGQLKVRNGALELFRACQSANVPTIILSAGVGNVIEIITQEHNMQPTLILSNKLHFSEDGRLRDWDRDSLTHILNKHEKGNAELLSIREQRPLSVLIGDSLEDTQMIKGNDNVLRIRVGDRHHHGKANWDAYLKQSFEAGYDLVVQPEDLIPIVQLTEWLVGAAGPTKK